jgi:hypothetical protein
MDPCVDLLIGIVCMNCGEVWHVHPQDDTKDIICPGKYCRHRKNWDFFKLHPTKLVTKDLTTKNNGTGSQKQKAA